MARRSIVALLAGEVDQYLACAMLQAEKGMVIMPDVVIAEVVGWQKPPQGHVEWRERKLPVLDLSGVDQRVCIIVCHAVHRPEQEFFAMAVKALPRMLRISVDDMKSVDAQLVYSWQRSWVTVDGRRMILPDFQKIEDKIIQGE